MPKVLSTGGANPKTVADPSNRKNGGQRGGRTKYVLFAIGALLVLYGMFGRGSGDEERIDVSVDAAIELGVSNVSATWTKDYSGAPCIVVSYEWTNNGDDDSSALTVLDVDAFQGGVSCELAIGAENGHDSGSSMLKLKPGATATVTNAFVLRDATSVVTVEFTKLFRDEPKLEFQFDPSSAGLDVGIAPETPIDIPETPSDLVETTGGEDLPAGAGYVGEHYVETKEAILSTDYEGNPVIVVTFAWTNNSDKGLSSMSEIMAKCFQDGVELESAVGIMNDEILDGKPYMTEIKPGASVDVQRAFLLRDTSNPVLFEMDELFGSDNPVSMTFTLSELEQVENTPLSERFSRDASDTGD